MNGRMTIGDVARLTGVSIKARTRLRERNRIVTMGSSFVEELEQMGCRAK